MASVEAVAVEHVSWGPPVVVIWVALALLVTYLLNRNSLLYRFFPSLPKIPFSTSNRKDIFHRFTQPTTFWAFELLDPYHMVESPFLNSTPTFLLYVLMALYFPAYMLVGYGLGNYHLDPAFMSYFTNWSMVLLGLTGVVGAVNSARHLSHRFRAYHHAVEQLDTHSSRGRVVFPAAFDDYVAPHRRWDWLNIAHCLLFESLATAGLFLAFYYWIVINYLARGGSGLVASNVMAHGGNVVVIFFIVVLTRQPFASAHFIAPLTYGILYVVFLWLYGELEDTWRYQLNWSQPGAVGAYILLPALFLLAFWVWFWVAKLREWLARSRVNRKEQMLRDGRAMQQIATRKEAHGMEMRVMHSDTDGVPEDARACQQPLSPIGAAEEQT